GPVASPGGSASHRRMSTWTPEARYFCPRSPLGEYSDLTFFTVVSTIASPLPDDASPLRQFAALYDSLTHRTVDVRRRERASEIVQKARRADAGTVIANRCTVGIGR